MSERPPSTPRDLPSFNVIAAALRRITEHLARELCSPQPRRPDWSEFEWGIARAVASMQGITALLARELRWRGPPQWQAFLELQLAQSIAREARIDTLIADVDRALRAADIGCVGLKGTALRSLGLYQPGERPMADLDLLARPGEYERGRDALGTIGYQECFGTWRDTTFTPSGSRPAVRAGEHPDNVIWIELHRAVAAALPATFVEITARCLAGRPAPGVNPYPTLTVLMSHLLLHAAGNMRAHGLRHIQLCDIARLAARLAPSDWDVLVAGGEESWWVFPPLALCERYWPGSLPSNVLERAYASCPRLLRTAATRWTLTEVSWSNLHIDAFPGMTWSRSLREASRFAASRVIPKRAALHQLQFALSTQPHLARVPWYGISHSARMLRWLFSYSPRVQTLSSVLTELTSVRLSANAPEAGDTSR